MEAYLGRAGRPSKDTLDDFAAGAAPVKSTALINVGVGSLVHSQWLSMVRSDLSRDNEPRRPPQPSKQAARLWTRIFATRHATTLRREPAAHTRRARRAATPHAAAAPHPKLKPRRPHDPQTP